MYILLYWTSQLKSLHSMLNSHVLSILCEYSYCILKAYFCIFPHFFSFFCIHLHILCIYMHFVTYFSSFLSQFFIYNFCACVCIFIAYMSIQTRIKMHKNANSSFAGPRHWPALAVGLSASQQQLCINSCIPACTAAACKIAQEPAQAEPGQVNAALFTSGTWCGYVGYGNN